MDNKPICGEWHYGNVMPLELKDCIFLLEINNKRKEILIGFREGNVIRNMNDEEICGEISVICWCYIDLNY
nr:MAG TPA: hypothetical protein [Caudoviricetes sp.]